VWNGTYDDLAGRNIVFVSAVQLRPSSEIRTTVYENFRTVETLTPYSVKYHGESIREVYVYRGHGFNPYEPRRLGPKSLHYRE
jgi:hypothetical protein